MSRTVGSRSKSNQLDRTLQNNLNESNDARKIKRLAQHQHWMRVMMEGQATPDLRYSKSKI